MGVKILRGVVKTAAVGALAYAGVSALAARILVRPKRRTAWGVTPALYGLASRDVFFPAREDGVKISGWYIPAEGAERAVVLVHGKDVSRVVELFGRFLELAQALQRAGFSVLMIDLRGHGWSGPGSFSFGLLERRDVLGAVDWLRGQGYSSGRIGVLGVSLGSSACLGAAADEPAIGATVSDSGFAMIEPVIRANWRAESHLPDFVLPGVTAVVRLMYGYDLQSSRPVEDAARISGGLLIIHGEQDSLVPPEHARLLSAAAPLAEVWMVAGAVHAGCYGVDPAAYTARVVSFFERWLT